MVGTTIAWLLQDMTRQYLFINNNNTSDDVIRAGEIFIAQFPIGNKYFYIALEVHIGLSSTDNCQI